MKKLFCFTALFAVIQGFSQSYQTKFVDQPVIPINCESYVIIPSLTKIQLANSPLFFDIKNGSLLITVSGIIDKGSSSQIMINLYAKESVVNEMFIIAAEDSQLVQYKLEGAGTGIYGGNLNDNDSYIINTRFKIVAPGHTSYILVLPLNVYISSSGNNNLVHCYINGKAVVNNAEKKKNKTRNKKNI